MPFEAADAVPKALQVVGSIVAPTTLLTALFAYFGLLYAVVYFRYLGVNVTVLKLPVQDLLILSASTATVPLALLAAVVLLALWVYRLPLEALSGWARGAVRYLLLPVVAAAGIVLLGLVAADTLLGRQPFPPGLLEARGLSLSIGVVLLPYAARLWRAAGPTHAPAHPTERPHESATVPLTVAKWMSVLLLFGVGLFWAVGSYAIRMGETGAQGLVAVLPCSPDVVLYSEKSLNLRTAGVPEEPATGADGAYGFRYPGLKLVPQTGDQYLLLPSDWQPGTRPAIVLPRSVAVRLEFTRVAGVGRPGC